ncbi:GPI-anchor transamidase subunit [Saccharomycopsis crataegensis]|uniref:GPI-anchor transamidase subunit n=1 Tax=Saccharomycopsis crataegensis TaxID=43959 RepID=A0AAV5QIX4_9ASCO|nr:GPI-anchor transamidase subunit [Saccharomycopsis crataegensis]
MLLLSILPLFFCSVLAIRSDGGSSFAEELSLTPLPNGHLHTNFNFNITSSEFASQSNSSSIISNFNIFPNSLINLLSQTNTKNLSIRFTSGYWNSESWGKLPHDGHTSGGNGLELWAKIEASSKEEAFTNWRFLVNSLSGFFCASLNFIDETITTFPEYSFGNTHDQGIYLLRAALPREPICTENLTPIIKLLPTKGRAGISSLLDGHKLFDSKWVSTSIDLNTIDSHNSQEDSIYYKLVINLNNVFNVPMSLSKIKRPLPKPIPGEELNCDYDKFYDAYHCFPSNVYNEGLSFDLDKIFGRKLKIDEKIGDSKICAYVNKTANGELIPENEKQNWELQGVLSSQNKETGHLLFAYAGLDENNCYSIPNKPEKREEFDYKLELKNSYNNIRISDEDKPKIYVSRSITGYELDKGGFRIVFKNPGDEDIDLIYFESLPWYLRLYLNSLKIVQKSLDQQDTVNNEEIIKDISYVTAIDRQRPAKLEMVMKIPKQSIITVTYSFDKSLLLYSEYPPDANHGFELESAVVTLIKYQESTSTSEPKEFDPYYVLRTSTLLVSLPTPDFSMPYNVIILTSTIMALIFGTVFNLLIKRIISEEDYEKLLEQAPKKNLQYFIALLKSKVKSTFQKSKKD